MAENEKLIISKPTKISQPKLLIINKKLTTKIMLLQQDLIYLLIPRQEK